MCTCACGCVWTGMCVHVYVDIGGQVYVYVCMCVLVCACVLVGVDGQVEKGMCGPQQCTGGSLVFVHRMVPEIDVFFLIPFSIVSCLVEALHLVKGINNNSSILRTHTMYNHRLSPVCC